MDHAVATPGASQIACQPEPVRAGGQVGWCPGVGAHRPARTASPGRDQDAVGDPLVRARWSLRLLEPGQGLVDGGLEHGDLLLRQPVEDQLPDGGHVRRWAFSMAPRVTRPP